MEHNADGSFTVKKEIDYRVNWEHDIVVEFDDHQLVRRNQLCRVGDWLVAWEPNPRLGWSHVFEITEIVNDTTIKIKLREGHKRKFDTLTHMSQNNRPLLAYVWAGDGGEYGIHESYMPNYIQIPRRVILEKGS